jgi:hypothetical protein
MWLLWVVGVGDADVSGDAVDAAECDGRRPWSIQVAHGTLIRPVCGRFSGFPFFLGFFVENRSNEFSTNQQFSVTHTHKICGLI